MIRSNYRTMILLSVMILSLMIPGCQSVESVPEPNSISTSVVQELEIASETAVIANPTLPTTTPISTSIPEPMCRPSENTLPPRADHEMVYDKGRGVIILFGGRDPGFSFPFFPTESSSRHVSETWEYDKCGWKRIDTEHEPPNFDDFDMVYDSAQNVTILLGQYTPIKESDSESISMMWQYDGQDWRQMIEVALLPSPRIYRGMVFDSFLNRIVIFGGYGNYISGGSGWFWDTGVFENGSWNYITEDIYEYPPPTDFPIMVYDETRNAVILWITRVYNFTSEFDGVSWDHLMDLPNRDGRPVMEFNRGMELFGGDMVYDVDRDAIVAHGKSGTWEYAFIENSWVRIESAGGPQSSWHAMVYDEDRGVTVLVGGIDGNGEPIEGMWVYDGKSWHQE